MTKAATISWDDIDPTVYVDEKGQAWLSWGNEFPEKTAYAMSRSLEGPWEYKGFLNEIAGNCNSNHQSIIEFKGKWYFIYHNGALTADTGSFHRSVCTDYLFHNNDGTLKRVVMTSGSEPPAK